MSLNNVASGNLGQNWFAAQNRKAAANRIALAISMDADRRANWKTR